MYQCISPPGRKRCKDGVVDTQLHHSFRYIVGTFERESSIDGKVVDNAGDECTEVTGPIGQMKDLFEQCEHNYLNDSRTDRKEYELSELDEIFLFTQRHSAFGIHG